MHDVAKAKIMECYDKNKSGDPEFLPLTSSMKEHLRSTVGELHWKKAHDHFDRILKQKNERVQQQSPAQHQQLQHMVLFPSTDEFHSEDTIDVGAPSSCSTDSNAPSLLDSSCSLDNTTSSRPESCRRDAHANQPRFCGNFCRRLRLWYRVRIQPFWQVKVAQLICVAYIVIVSLSVPLVDENGQSAEPGVIYVNNSPRPVDAGGKWQKICLVLSRMSAFSMYPMLVVVFVTKMKATLLYLSSTPLSMYLGILKQAHEHHAHAGAWIAFDVWIHTLFHVLRWWDQDNLKLLWNSRAGLSGLIVLIATPLIALPMMMCKDRLSYEIRKG
jgi:hypothetical protein